MTSTIATRLQELRRRLGFAKRADMAQHLEVPSSTYSAYEGASGPPKVDWLVALGRRGVNLNWLLIGVGDMMRPPELVPPTGTQANSDDGVSAPRVDPFLLAAMIRRVEQEEQERGQPMDLKARADTIASLYTAAARATESELASNPLARAAEGPDR